MIACVRFPGPEPQREYDLGTKAGLLRFVREMEIETSARTDDGGYYHRIPEGMIVTIDNRRVGL